MPAAARAQITTIADAFQRADTAAGTLGVPDAYTPPGTNGAWLVTGGVKIASHNATLDSSSSGPTLSNRAIRPYSESELGLGTRCLVGPIDSSGGDYYDLFCREQSDGFGIGTTFYFTGGNCTVSFYWHNSGGTAGLGGGGSFSAPAGSQYFISAQPSGASGAAPTIIATVIDRTSGNVLATYTCVASGANSETFGAGSAGFGFNAAYNKTALVASADLLYVSASNLNANAQGIASSSSGNGIVLSGTGTSWLTSNPTFTASGVSGVTITEQHIVSNTEAVVYLSAGSTNGTLTITDPSQSAPNTATISVAAGAAASLLVGQPQAIASTVSGSVQMLLAPAFAGVGPYTYTAYRARTSTFAVGSGTALSGGSVTKDSSTGLLKITDTPPDSKLYTYRVVATDAFGSPNTGQGASGASYIGYAPIPTPATITALPGGNSMAVKIGFVGDSIMNHTVSGPSEIQNATTYLGTPGNAASVSIVNEAFAGATCLDFDPALPGGHAGYWTAAKAAFLSGNTKVVVLRLGTNDSGNGISGATFQAVMGRIAADLASSNIKLRLEYPDWQFAQDSAVNDLIVSYCDAIDTVTAANTGSNMVPAERRAAPYFVGRGDLFADNLHPTDGGAVVYGADDADAELSYDLSQIPTVSGVSVSPATVTLAGSGTQTFVATVSGTNSPAQTVTWTASAGTINASTGGFVAPSATGSVQTITVTATSTVDNTKSGTATVTVNSLSTAATPTFSPAAGTYSSAQSITLATTTSGATIRYTIDGSTPSESNGTIYSAAVGVASSETLKAIAYESGYSDSAVATASYTITSSAATPTFSPPAGAYGPSQTVTISTATGGATIYYTVDGSTPTTSSAVYSGPITVGATETVKALATASGMTNSAVGSAAYTINGAASTPTFSPAAGAYGSTQTVTIATATSASTIYYTLDGSTPTTSSAVYSAPISVATSETVKAIAVASGYSNSSVGSAAYVISGGAVATPTFSPAAGSYSATQTVTISSATSGASLYYTLDGSTPTTSSSLYSAPISVSASETIKALATHAGMTNSAIGSAAYVISSGSGSGSGMQTTDPIDSAYPSGVTAIQQIEEEYVLDQCNYLASAVNPSTHVETLTYYAANGTTILATGTITFDSTNIVKSVRPRLTMNWNNFAVATGNLLSSTVIDNTGSTTVTVGSVQRREDAIRTGASSRTVVGLVDTASYFGQGGTGTTAALVSTVTTNNDGSSTRAIVAN